MAEPVIQAILRRAEIVGDRLEADVEYIRDGTRMLTKSYSFSSAEQAAHESVVALLEQELNRLDGLIARCARMRDFVGMDIIPVLMPPPEPEQPPE